MSCVRWGCIAWSGIYDYACMGLDQKDIPPGIGIGEFFGITVASILVDDFFAFSLCIATHCKFALWVFFGRAVTCDYNSLHCSG
jgi:hypothetical protein